MTENQKQKIEETSAILENIHRCLNKNLTKRQYYDIEKCIENLKDIISEKKGNSRIFDHIGILEPDIDNAAEQVETAMKQCGFSDIEIDGMYKTCSENLAFSMFESDATDTIISCLFDTASHFIESRTDRKVEYDICGHSSTFALADRETSCTSSAEDVASTAPAIADGTRCIFDTRGGDTELNDRSGETVTVIRALTEEEADLEDVGPMYKIEFSDGFRTDAFEDELTPCRTQEGGKP